MPRRRLPLSLLALIALSGSLDAGIFGTDERIEEVCQFSIAPSCLVADPDGDWLIGVDPKEQPRFRAMRVTSEGEASPFPNESMSVARAGEALPLDSIEALQIDRDGIGWLLDNGRRGEVPPKIIGWNMGKDRLERVIHLGSPSVPPGSYCTDLIIDPDAPYAYISDPAHGHDAALIVVNLLTGLSRRVLEGDPSVQPDLKIAFAEETLDQLAVQRLDGTATVPHTGVRSLTIDRKGEWLYFAAMQSQTLYRIRTEALRDPSLAAEELRSRVEVHATIPPTTSLAMDSKDNLYLSPVEGRTIGWVSAKTGEYESLVVDIRLLRPSGLTFGRDGLLHFFSPTREQASEDQATNGIYSLFRFEAPGSGRAGQ